jgi:lysophospholipase L1-like esterase
MTNTAQLKASALQGLQNKLVVFGHQSIGDNLVNGLQRLAEQADVKLAIQEQRTASASKGVSHFYIGENGNPASKIQDFAATIDAGAGQGADLALMKLCYADFNATSDGRQLATNYIDSLEALAKRHPQTAFVAVTAPLMAAQTGPKAWIKRFLGRQPSGYLDNVRRAEFNAMLRDKYQSSGRLFDLARLESQASASSCTVSVDGQVVEALCPEFTDDGGHLNERGQAVMASAFLNFVSSFSAK